MTNKKANVLMVLGLFVLIGLIGGLSIAFFNYTRTGSPNLLTTGDISFNSNYETVTIANVFPIATANVGTDTNNVMTVNVNVTGRTTYAKGLYYEVTADDVNLTVNGKNIPVSIQTTASNLNNVTLTSYEDGKVLTDGSLFAYGTIPASDETHDNSVDGTITLKVYLDASKIAVTDTIENGAIYATGYDNGTNTGWINGRTVLTTTEWNNLANTPLSFKVKVEAYENDVARLVDGTTFIGKIKKISNPNLDDSYDEWEYWEYDENITSFQRVVEAPNINAFTTANIISTNDSAYPIYAWYDNGVIKYYSESQNIKANTDMSYMFFGLMELLDISSFANLDTTNVTDMSYMLTECYVFNGLSALSNWNVANVTNMESMLKSCALTSLTPIEDWNTLNVTDMNAMFIWNESLTSLTPLADWNVSKVTNMSYMFGNCSALTNLSGLSNWDVSNTTNMRYMFESCTSLNDASGINDWDINSVTNFTQMFRSAPSHPTFTKRAGTWSNGTFTPSA